MNLSLLFLRTLFFILCIFFITTYTVSSGKGPIQENVIEGILLGSFLWCILVGIDYLFKRFNLRSFNIAIIGIFVGYLMGEALVLIFNAIVSISSPSFHLDPSVLEITKISLFLLGTYLGTIMTLKASDEFCISVPFIKFAPISKRKKDLLLDRSALTDSRLLDLAITGIFNNQLIIPRFIIKELYAQIEIGDEPTKIQSKKSLELVKKLEALPDLGVRFSETDFPEVKDSFGKIIRLARLLDTNILSSDISKLQTFSLEGILIVNLHSLSNALKPLTETGEYIKIKIQRHGKEPRQGIGYLEDGTMVVVNGGGKHLGATIDAQVLSVKHTSSGRMVFCNACDAENLFPNFTENLDDEPN